MSARLLAVCTGNTCRSPMLAAFLCAGARRLELPLAVESCGVAAATGGPASKHAVTTLAERGIDLADHRSRPIDDCDLRAYDQVWCMGEHHALACLELGAPQERVFVVRGERGGVPDPVGGDLDAYRACADVLQVAAEDILADLAKPSG